MQTTTPSPGGRREYWITFFGSWVLRLLALTLRIEVDDPESLRKAATGEPCIFVFWHNRLLLVPIVWGRYFLRHRPLGKALTSTSRDGELIAHFLARFGIGSIRGSATRRGSAALREMAAWLRKGNDVAITPDGSRGPLYEIKPGLVLLAQLSGRPMLPMSFDFSRAWRLKSWDGFLIPKPFSRVTFRVGKHHRVARTYSDAEFEAARQQCEQVMRAQIS